MVYTLFIVVLLLIFEFLNLEFLLSVWVESLCLLMNVCFVIFVIMRSIHLQSFIHSLFSGASLRPAPARL